MSEKEFAIKYLKAIEKKHEKYFKENELQITDCVVIVGSKLVSVHVKERTLPFEITYDIESVFWA